MSQQTAASTDTNNTKGAKRRRNKDGYYIEPYTVSVEDVRPSYQNNSNNRVKSKSASPLAENVILVHKNGLHVYVRHLPLDDYKKVTKHGRSFYEVPNDKEERKLLCLSLTNPPEEYYMAAAAEQQEMLLQYQQQRKSNKDNNKDNNNNTENMQINKELMHQLQLLDAPAVLDTYQPPAPRVADLRVFKHKNKMNYMKYKMMYSDEDLRMIEMEDRRALLTHEKRQVFLKQVQQDFAFRAKVLSSASSQRQQQAFSRFVQHNNMIQNVTHTSHLIEDGFIFTRARQVFEQHMQMFFLIRDQQQCVQRRQLREAARGAGKNQNGTNNNNNVHFFTLDQELLNCVTGPSRPVDGCVMLFTERTFANENNNTSPTAATAKARNALFFESEEDTEEEKLLRRGGVVISIVYGSSTYLSNPNNEAYKKKDYFSVDNYYKEVNNNNNNNVKNDSCLYEANHSSRNISDLSNNSSDVVINNDSNNPNSVVTKKTIVMKQRNTSQIVSRNETPLKKQRIVF